jgi:hypothetical protein
MSTPEPSLEDILNETDEEDDAFIESLTKRCLLVAKTKVTQLTVVLPIWHHLLNNSIPIKRYFDLNAEIVLVLTFLCKNITVKKNTDPNASVCYY